MATPEIFLNLNWVSFNCLYDSEIRNLLYILYFCQHLKDFSKNYQFIDTSFN